jgi:hypothetical protein
MGSLCEAVHNRSRLFDGIFGPVDKPIRESKMSDAIEAGRGRKFEQPEPAILGLGKDAVPNFTPRQDMVEAQCYCGMAACPYCGHVVWDTGLNPGPHTIVCPRCGQSFLAP